MQQGQKGEHKSQTPLAWIIELKYRVINFYNNSKLLHFW